MESAIGEDIAKAKGVDLVVVNPVLVLGPLLQPTINASIIHVLKYLTGSAKIYANSVQAYVHKSVVTDPGDDDTVNPRPGTLRHAVIQNEPLWIVFKRDIMNTTTQDSDTTTSTTASAAASYEAALEEAPPQPPSPPAAAAASAKTEPPMAACYNRQRMETQLTTSSSAGSGGRAGRGVVRTSCWSNLKFCSHSGSSLVMS
ncbi:uncharacterized protein LOC109947081 [Prunus persica]|uniref:uncharacterized protein LOC109947081 n=1 Tax=Prunus persica TaxID=3760 RepID=UPI0009AB73A9|nr:uncharacterized protein LOC109947081 [Prunus persica]